LAVVGLFGVTAFVARQRLHEIGVRLTLGATRRDIIVMLLRHSLTPVAIGLVAGLAAAMLWSRVLQRVLFGVSANDPLAMLVAVVILLAASVAAIVPTARRAARVDLVGMLRAL
jgi:ABC-type antimicrobial peptide transport system permease subunit